MTMLVLTATAAEALRLLIAKHTDECMKDHGLNDEQVGAMLDLYVELDDAKQRREEIVAEVLAGAPLALPYIAEPQPAALVG